MSNVPNSKSPRLLVEQYLAQHRELPPARITDEWIAERVAEAQGDAEIAYCHGLVDGLSLAYYGDLPFGRATGEAQR